MRPAVIWLDFLLCFGVCAIVEWGWFPLFFIIQINIFLLNSPPSLFSVLMVNTNLKETEKALFCSSFFFFFPKCPNCMVPTLNKSLILFKDAFPLCKEKENKLQLFIDSFNSSINSRFLITFHCTLWGTTSEMC